MPVAVSTTRCPVAESFVAPDLGGRPDGVEPLAGTDQVREFGPTSTRTGSPAAEAGATCPRAHNETSVSAKASHELVFINSSLKPGDHSCLFFLVQLVVSLSVGFLPPHHETVCDQIAQDRPKFDSRLMDAMFQEPPFNH